MFNDECEKQEQEWQTLKSAQQKNERFERMAFENSAARVYQRFRLWCIIGNRNYDYTDDRQFLMFLKDKNFTQDLNIGFLKKKQCLEDYFNYKFELDYKTMNFYKCEDSRGKIFIYKLGV